MMLQSTQEEEEANQNKLKVLFVSYNEKQPENVYVYLCVFISS